MSLQIRRGLLACAVICVTAGSVARADEGWVIDRFDIRYDIQADGSVRARDAIDVDFGTLSRHGIYRDLTSRLSYDASRNRLYTIDLVGVTDASGHRLRASSSANGNERRFKIGDPDRTVSGRQTYRIAYTIEGALNAFADHDEFFWNATGSSWPVPTRQASVTVAAPAGSIDRIDCFEGFFGSTERCALSRTADAAEFRATRPLAAGEQLTVVVGLRKGAVTVGPPLLREKPHDLLHFFERSPGTVGGLVLGLFAAVNAVGLLWWWAGRDRRYIALQHAGAGAAEERVPLLGARPVGVEFQPPGGLRPGQMGLLLDERADTLDVTATIIDLAVRGYLRIEEIEPAHWFSRRDWLLTRLKTAAPELLPYERIVFEGLFPSGSETKLSALKNKFYKDLALARKSLYADAMQHRWFAANPDTVRTWSRIGGWVVFAAGVFIVIYLGSHWGAGLLGLPVMAAGLFLAVMARAMPRRTAAGVDMLQRTLGFMRYIRTAETSQQAFAERANLFTEYLPYAVAFKCVEKWARAFRGVDLQAATGTWYSGSTPFNPSSLSSSLGTFSNSVSSTMTSTPGGSGSSGFSGGSSGGGGGGGGGGSW
jgi:hypothetical protein